MPISPGQGLKEVNLNPVATSQLTAATIDTSTIGDNTLVTPTASQTTKVYKMVLGISPSTTIRIKNGATTLTGPIKVSSMTLDFDSEPWFVTSANSTLTLWLNEATNAAGRIYYIKD